MSRKILCPFPDHTEKALPQKETGVRKKISLFLCIEKRRIPGTRERKRSACLPIVRLSFWCMEAPSETGSHSQGNTSSFIFKVIGIATFYAELIELSWMSSRRRADAADAEPRLQS